MDHLRLLAVVLSLLAVSCDSPAPPVELSNASERLQRYLKIDTSNPPGLERDGIKFLAAELAREDIRYEVLERSDGRHSLWAHLPGVGEAGPSKPGSAPQDGAQTLLLLHHVDVIPADDAWTHGPFSGQVAEGALWGRGAIDTKGLGIAQLEAFVALAKREEPRERGVALLAAADEEAGGSRGVGYWIEQRPDLFEGVTAVLNEGGSNRSPQGNLQWWGLEVTQKRPLWIGLSDPSPESLVTGLARLVDRPVTWRVTEEAKAHFVALAPHFENPWKQSFLDLDRFILPEGPTGFLFPGMETFFLDSAQVNQIEVLPD